MTTFVGKRPKRYYPEVVLLVEPKKTQPAANAEAIDDPALVDRIICLENTVANLTDEINELKKLLRKRNQ